ncbi:carbon-nitrogen hydrolase family protein [Skermanella mucosa]|uniref:carbon-nitrogen hydrolase family protein n=1 Tax=Skermanella mucosa TaxID=1789672 RepID=UPI00192C3AFA|nr:carbon-nitrogen hydrolase family protein [Skermanella mucosa]UEM19671.1 carbon-nitrogen hydrolase family protein [Skermanella mucosa]
MEKFFRVGAASTGPAGGGEGCALAGAERAAEALAGAGADLVILPELFAVPYAAAEDPGRFPHPAEPLDGPTAAWAVGVASRLGVPILFGMALSPGGPGKPFNAAVLARPEGIAEAIALKIHLPPAAPGEPFGEADHFDAGPARIGTVRVGPIRLATLVCYDRRFPECWRAAAAAGADLVAVLVAGPAPDDPDGIFLAELRTHARANAVYAVSAARSGIETINGRSVRHDGDTVAVGPDGTVVSGPGAAVLADIDPARLLLAAERNPTARRLRAFVPQ